MTAGDARESSQRRRRLRSGHNGKVNIGGSSRPPRHRSHGDHHARSGPVADRTRQGGRTRDRDAARRLEPASPPPLAIKDDRFANAFIPPRTGWGPAAWYQAAKDDGGSILRVASATTIRFADRIRYASVTARQAVKLRPDYPECEDCGALLLDMNNGGQATLTFDYFRPASATSHGDDRLRVAGSKGIVEVRLAGETFCELITQDEPARRLPLPDSHRNVFVDFVAELRGQGRHFLTPEDPFRATEVAIKARDAADIRTTMAL
jgi:hypothetical protein